MSVSLKLWLLNNMYSLYNYVTTAVAYFNVVRLRNKFAKKWLNLTEVAHES